MRSLVGHAMLAAGATPASAAAPATKTHRYPITQQPFRGACWRRLLIPAERRVRVQEKYETDNYELPGTLARSVVPGRTCAARSPGGWGVR
jgi:hypothetical protein